MINPLTNRAYQAGIRRGILAAALLTTVLIILPSRAVVAASAPALQVVSCQDIDWPMSHQPELTPPPTITTFDPRLLQLWLGALDQPDTETRRQAADAITLATKQGLKTARAKAGPKLLSILEGTFNSTTDQTVLQLSCAQALVVIDYAPAADTLRKLTAAGNPEFCLLIDPTLAKWSNSAAIEGWMKRLEQPHTANSSIVSAIEALVALHHTEVIPACEKLVVDTTQSLTVRRAAARALATLAPDAQDTRATDLYNVQGSFNSRLLAQPLISGSRSPAAEALLLKMIDDTEPAIVVPAIKQLTILNPRSLAAAQLALSKHADATVRATLIPALTKQKTESASSVLIQMLADPQMAIRNAARAGLVELYQKAELQPTITAQLQKLIATPNTTPWYQLEEIIYLTATVKDKAVAEKWLSLLDHPQAPVRLAVIQAYRTPWDLESTQPNARLLKRAEKLAAQLRPGKASNAVISSLITDDAVSIELAQLVQTLAMNRVLAVAPICHTFVPKNSGSETLRKAAIWSLGTLYQDNPQPQFIEALKRRINDTAMLQGELTSIRVASIIAIGQMKARSEEPFIRSLYDKYSENMIKLSTRWALMQITGQSLPELPPNSSPASGFFLEPLQ